MLQTIYVYLYIYMYMYKLLLSDCINRLLIYDRLRFRDAQGFFAVGFKAKDYRGLGH